ncbi:hypothetical protein IFM89_017545 [Coptis chinensis]|uniref:Sodium/calcium exchanger membrane region domain-containing protein n=1 Tax=Coptis chinensis TaxID=261450 RepID=A0A835HVI9_9MAGN|nr:hypothetical protein IFM89_017545 [Coptis chinensis]
MAFFSTFLKTSLISLTILFSLLYFLIITKPTLKTSIIPHRSLLNTTLSSPPSCDSNGLFNYSSLHFCLFKQDPFLSIPSLVLILLLQFYFLVKTAQDHFSIVVTKLAKHLNLSPSMGAVTLLALGNGAPDVFASIAAVRSGHARTGLGAILSAGTFVSAFVVGFVAIYASPFSVEPAPFVRDVFFYLTAALSLFYVYLSGEIFIWQAIGFVGFYVFFVGFVFWMDIGVEGGRKKDGVEMVERQKEEYVGLDCEYGEQMGIVNREKPVTGLYGILRKTSGYEVVGQNRLLVESSFYGMIPRFYLSVNIALCPLALLYSFGSVFPMNHRIVFLLPNTHFPLWLVVLFASSSLALVHYIVEKEPPETEQMPAVLIAFVMSVFWISTVAGELLDCLAVVGIILDLPPALLGLTVLAWGNSVGDLVADVAVAKAGQPAMAMAGCFAGPMFNMLVGLGTALVIETADVYPMAYQLHFHISIVVAFVFLLLSLMGSLLVVTWFRFRVPRFWGFCLVGLYILFTAVSLVIAKFSR